MYYSGFSFGACPLTNVSVKTDGQFIIVGHSPSLASGNESDIKLS